MTAVGYVKKINQEKNTAIIEIKRQSACGENCASCGLCKNPPILMEAENQINAVQGDKVEVFSKSTNVLLSAFLMYIVPVLILIIEIAFVTSAVSDLLFKITVAGIIAAVGIIWFVVMKIIDKKISGKIRNVIVKKYN